MDRFSQKELKFIDLLLKGKPAGVAYKEAGYKAKTRSVADTEGWRLTRKPKIASVIERANRQSLEKAELDNDWVISRLKNEALGLGVDTSPAARVKALELLGKRLKLFGDDPPPVGKSELIIKVIGGEASMSDLLPRPQLTEGSRDDGGTKEAGEERTTAGETGNGDC